MSEKKTKKPVEFRIVRSSLFPNAKNSQSLPREKKKEGVTQKEKIIKKVDDSKISKEKNIYKSVYFKLISSNEDSIFIRKCYRKGRNELTKEVKII